MIGRVPEKENTVAYAEDESQVYTVYSALQNEDLVLDYADGSDIPVLNAGEESRPDRQRWRVYTDGRVQNVEWAKQAPRSGYLTRRAADGGPVTLADLGSNEYQVWHFGQGPRRTPDDTPGETF